jgi:surface carbohydrate biosynthesis protein
MRVRLRGFIRFVVGGLCSLAKGQVEFTRIHEVDFLVWDATAAESFLMLSEIGTVGILHTRRERFNFNPHTVFRLTTRILKGTPKGEAYLASCVEQYRPVAVFTFIDNDVRFHKVATYFPHTEFVAVQNGWRWPRFEDEPFPLPQGTFVSTMLCFSEFDIQSWREFGIEFRRIQAIGSLHNDWYRRQRGSTIRPESGETADICLVSQYRESIDQDCLDVWIEFRRLLQLLGRFLRTRPLITVAVALVSETASLGWQHEVAFFSRYLPNTVGYRPRVIAEMSNYALTDNCHVTVASSSTLGIESLARRNRTLMVGGNIANSVARAGYQDALWVTGAGSDTEFDVALDRLLAIDDCTFGEISFQSAEYFSGPPSGGAAIPALREIALLALGRRKSGRDCG